jgi:hypothetical protein
MRFKDQPSSGLSKMEKNVILAIYNGLAADWATCKLEFEDGDDRYYFLWRYRRHFLKGRYPPASMTRCIRRLTVRHLVDWPQGSQYLRPQVKWITLTEEGQKLGELLSQQ